MTVPDGPSRYRLQWATCPRAAKRPVPEVVETEPAPVFQPPDGEVAAGATGWTAARRWITTLSAHLAPRPGPAPRVRVTARTSLPRHRVGQATWRRA